jgi:predicted lipoprotein with Yx(FWY)xxD motif
MRILIALVVLAGTLAGVSASVAASTTAPAIRYQDARFGAILATPAKQALYFWNDEKRAKGKILCTGSCAEAWPPLYATGRVRTRLRGIAGTFGTVVRPDGRRQVTFDGSPLYTYVNDSPGVILCDNQDGWFVVRLR